MQVICGCGEEMSLSQYEPDQDECFVGFDCVCGASLYGTAHFSEIESGVPNQN